MERTNIATTPGSSGVQLTQLPKGDTGSRLVLASCLSLNRLWPSWALPPGESSSLVAALGLGWGSGAAVEHCLQCASGSEASSE